MRVLISGGVGYIGGRLAVHLSRAGHKVVLGSRKPSKPPEWLPDAEMVQTKWNDQVELSRICRNVDAVIHAAGMNAQDCLVDPVAALDFNGFATARFVTAAAEVGVKKFIYLSTAHVYASPLAGTITEATCPRNLHPYATSHLTGENAALHAGHSGLIKSVVLRLSNAVGAPMHRDVNCWGLLTNDLCRQAVERKQMTLYRDGTQLRDFVALSEVARIIASFLGCETKPLQTNVFNLGSAVSLSLLDIAKAVQERCESIQGLKPDIVVNSLDSGGFSLNYRIEALEKHGIKVDPNLTLELENLLRFCMREFGAH